MCGASTCHRGITYAKEKVRPAGIEAVARALRVRPKVLTVTTHHLIPKGVSKCGLSETSLSQALGC